MSLRQQWRTNSLVRFLYFQWIAFKQFVNFQPLGYISSLFWFWRDYFRLKSFPPNPNFQEKLIFTYPCLTDRTETTPIEPVYFFQDAWAAQKIFELKPKELYDIGSSIKTMSIIAQAIPVIFVDIRKIDVQLNGLTFLEASITQLPFPDNCIECISSLCVVEHIGLGRYGDPLDNWGSEKAVAELKRVVAPNGHVLFSVPVDKQNQVHYNANRAFSRDYVLQLFDGFKLIEERYIYGYQLTESYDPSKGAGTGLYLFQKPII
ncbi:MAG: class I SAM-dependent methyltransferase [Bacteroidia bacterium]|nr:class I SAM-dependent methyltransferase [Bacteroidia bacterium]